MDSVNTNMLEGDPEIQLNEGSVLIQIKRDGGLVATSSDGTAGDMAHQLGEVLGLYLTHNNIKFNRAKLWLLFELGVIDGCRQQTFKEADYEDL